jgi:farnesyl diphosphate synthase
MAASGELIHCYSLIHDDLPSMDDDDFRRGKLSCHKKFDEATAILAGDAIQPLALEILTTIEDKNLKAEKKLKIINLFAKACGPKGMVEGQSRDLDAEGKKITLRELDEIHHLKTGKLIEACVESICTLKDDLPKSHKKAFLDFAKKFGLAFQIKDDILDVTGDEKIIGKPINSDSKLKKASYPSIIGLKASQKRAEKLCNDALSTLTKLPYDTTNLILLSNYIVLRNK